MVVIGPRVSGIGLHQPRAPEPLGELLERQLCRPHPRPIKSKSPVPTTLLARSLELLNDRSSVFPFFALCDFSFLQCHQSDRLSFHLLTTFIVFTVA